MITKLEFRAALLALLDSARRPAGYGAVLAAILSNPTVQGLSDELVAEVGEEEHNRFMCSVMAEHGDWEWDRSDDTVKFVGPITLESVVRRLHAKGKDLVDLVTGKVLDGDQT